MKIRSLVVCLAVLFFSLSLFAGGSEVATKTSKLTIGGRLQPQYKYVDSEPSTSEMFLRRARLSFTSQLSKTIGFKLQLEAGKQKITLKDAYLSFKMKAMDIFVGQKHVPFSREALNSSKYLQMVERSITSEFAPYRQLGIGVQGFLWDKKLEYMAGVYNGAVDGGATAGLAGNQMNKVKVYHIDGGASADNNKYLYAFRLDFHPFGYMKKQQSYLKSLDHPLLTIGLNFYSSDDSPSAGHTAGAVQLKKTSAYGGDIAFQYKGFAGTFEYISRDISWWNAADTVATAPQYSYTVQGGFMIVKQRFEITARYEFLEFDKNGLLLGPVGENADKWLTFGFNYFFSGHHMKIQFNYIQKKEDMPAGMAAPDNDTALVQFAYCF